MYRRIRDLREDRDLLQKDLAAYLQCSQVCYSYYEMGKRDIPTDVLLRLADFYSTSTDYLLGRTDDPSPYPPAAHWPPRTHSCRHCHSGDRCGNPYSPRTAFPCHASVGGGVPDAPFVRRPLLCTRRAAPMCAAARQPPHSPAPRPL